ncbi:MAG: FtsW/RodA/SpoVE family cell cycle protein [Bacteroidetes bacterium]|nr:FtsW/RodA/SpoVE family cell cycle protein [Bacteroidota bacterium]
MGKRIGHIDWYILLPIVGLMFFSIAFVYSASAPFAELKFGSRETLFLSHSIRIGIGLLTLLLFSRIDYHLIARFSKFFLIIAIGLLVFVLFGGEEVKGASRWVNLGFFRFQPSEFAKFALILHLSVLLTKKQEYIKDFKEGMLPLLIWSGIVIFLILLQPNHSTAFIILVISISMMFIGNVNLFHLSGLSVVGMAILTSYAIVAKYPIQRVSAFLGLSKSSEVVEVFNYQLQQSLIALGNGGIIGLGPGQSRQSALFLPESYGDFIFSVIGEEYGFIGAAIIIIVFLIILWRGMIVAKNSPDTLGYFLTCGIIITLTIYAFVNASVNCGLLPTTGLPMPFISYGGTAVIFHCAAVGVLLNISAQAGVYPKEVKPVIEEQDEEVQPSLFNE